MLVNDDIELGNVEHLYVGLCFLQHIMINIFYKINSRKQYTIIIFIEIIYFLP